MWSLRFADRRSFAVVRYLLRLKFLVAERKSPASEEAGLQGGYAIFFGVEDESAAAQKTGERQT